MAENKPVDADQENKATPLAAAEPVEMPAILGATFAERASANKSASSKQVKADDVEDKAVTKKRASSKKS